MPSTPSKSSGFSITAVERKIGSKHIDIFICGDDGNVYTAWLDEGHAWSTATRRPNWRRWRNLGGQNFPPRAPVAAISRRPNLLDIFVCGSDHHIYTKWWSHHDGWNDSWLDLGGAGDHGDLFAPGTEITAVTRASEKIDLFGSATTGDVYKCYWCGDSCCNGWSSLVPRLLGRWKNLEGHRHRSSAAANVAVVSRDSRSFDAFFCDDEGFVLHKGWHPRGWDEQWEVVNGGRLVPGGHISATTRKPNHMDLFACGRDGCVYTSAWHEGQGWSSANRGSWGFIGGGNFPPGAPISAVAVNEGHLDIGLVDRTGSMHRKWWDEKLGHWQNWIDLEGASVPGSHTASLSLSPTSIDLFLVRSSGEVFTMTLGVSSNYTTWNHWASIGTLPAVTTIPYQGLQPPRTDQHIRANSAERSSDEPLRQDVGGGEERAFRPTKDSHSNVGRLMGSDDLGTLEYKRKKTDDWFTGLQKLIRRHGIRYNPGNALKVAVLDTGINMDGCWNFDEYEKNRVREKASFMDSDGRADVDKDGHGSRIAAIILRLTKNVDLYIAKVTDSEYIGQAEVVKALKHARTVWKVQIVSMSFGFHRPLPELFEEIDNCLKDGITIFASASNMAGGGRRTYPASHGSVLCIYSATWEGRGSTYNPKLAESENFSAVGEEVRPMWSVTSPATTEQCDYDSGTSFATPVAVSITAFMIAYIQKKWPDHNWIMNLSSTAGIRNIFGVISDDFDGYDWVSPMRYLDDTDEGKVFEDLKHELDFR